MVLREKKRRLLKKIEEEEGKGNKKVRRYNKKVLWRYLSIFVFLR